jgi:hypothetical protein
MIIITGKRTGNLLEAVSANSYITGYHSTPYSDAGKAIKNGTFDGGAGDDRVLFAYLKLNDILKDQAKRGGKIIYGGYGEFIVQFSVPAGNMIDFRQPSYAAVLRNDFGVTASLKTSDDLSIYCYHHKKETSGIWGCIDKDSVVILFKKSVFRHLKNIKVCNQTESPIQWYDVDAIIKKYPDHTIASKQSYGKGLNKSPAPNILDKNGEYRIHPVTGKKIYLTALDKAALAMNPKFQGWMNNG